MPVSATVPPVASTVKLPVPEIVPLSTGVKALRANVLLPLVVKVCRVCPTAVPVPLATVPPVPRAAPV